MAEPAPPPEPTSVDDPCESGPKSPPLDSMEGDEVEPARKRPRLFVHDPGMTPFPQCPNNTTNADSKG